MDVERTAILSSLSQVGPAKPLGYLPLHTICDILHMDARALAAEAEANGLSALLIGPEQCCIKSGALYIFDKQSLGTLLRSSSSTLSENCWPLDPTQFVARVACEWIDQAHPVASVIHRAFGN